ncbi:MAG: STAS domain-containing protein [Candidatus Rifleibacteriota bacterium]
MKIERNRNEASKTIVFQIEGELDVHHVKNLKSEILESLEPPGWTYELNMDRVSYLDSSGLGMLVYLKKEIIKHEGKLKISNLHEPVMNVFKLTKLDTFFEIQ